MIKGDNRCKRLTSLKSGSKHRWIMENLLFIGTNVTTYRTFRRKVCKITAAMVAYTAFYCLLFYINAWNMLKEACLALSTVGWHNTMSLICCELSAACSEMWVDKPSELKTRLRYNDEYRAMRMICHLPSSEWKAMKRIAMIIFESGCAMSSRFTLRISGVLDNDKSLEFLFFFPFSPVQSTEYRVQSGQPEIFSG